MSRLETFAAPDTDDRASLRRRDHPPRAPRARRLRAVDRGPCCGRGPLNTPTRTLAAQRGAGDRWETLSYGEARAKADALAQALLDLGLGPARPLMVLSRKLDRAPAAQPRRLHRGRAGDADQRRVLVDERGSRPHPGDRRTDATRAYLRRRRGAVREGTEACSGGHKRSLREAHAPERCGSMTCCAPRPQPAVGAGVRHAGPQVRRRTAVHVRLDRRAEGRDQHQPDAVLRPGDASADLAVLVERAAGTRRLAPVESHVRRQPQPQPRPVQRGHAVHRRRADRCRRCSPARSRH